MQESTYIVAPMYEALMNGGIEAVEITARKVHLIKGGERVLSAFYKQSDVLSNISVWDWIRFVESAASK